MTFTVKVNMAANRVPQLSFTFSKTLSCIKYSSNFEDVTVSKAHTFLIGQKDEYK